jgi:hypothetical protein
VIAAACAYGLKRVLPFHQAVLVGLCVLSLYGGAYLLLARLSGIEAPGSLMRLLGRRRG